MFDVNGYLGTYLSVLDGLDRAAVDTLADLVFTTWRSARTVFLCGNGGSAATATHVSADLVKLTTPEGTRRLRAVALGEGLPGFSAAANDIGYDQVFAEQLDAFLRPGDLVVGLSTSGASPNVLRAIEFARGAGATTAGITGLHGRLLHDAVHHCLVVPSASVQQVEDATMVVGHLLCLAVRARVDAHLAPAAAPRASAVRASGL
ncbi:MAG: SIS domain-containing protein [Vicinamibacterales bacterium]